MAKIPEGMQQVTEQQFFAALYRDPRDIMPSHRMPEHTTWETKDREVWGWSTPGWRNPGAPEVWAVGVGAIVGDSESSVKP